MIQKITLFLLLQSSLLAAQDSLCKLNKTNIIDILNFGSDQKQWSRKAFELNCRSFNDTLSFYIDKDNGDIKEGQLFYLKNNRVAIYRRQQQKNSLILWQPKKKGKDTFFYIDFERLCAGETSSGYLKVSCAGNQFELEDILVNRKID
jgi:hypothetical protein